MRLPVAEPSPLRRAALSLHALHDADRDWILASLPSAPGERLRILLNELQDLGIPSRAVPMETWADPLPGTVAYLWTLQDEELVWLANLLRAEPPVIATTLLGVHPWPWRERFRALLNASKSEPAWSAAPCDPAPTALQTAVLQAVCHRMQTAARRPAQRRAFSWRAMLASLHGRAGRSP